MGSAPPFDAYRRAIYRVDAPAGPIDLRIGRRSAALDALLAERGARRWGFLTAVNPGSVRLPAADNEERTARLGARLEELGWKRLTGSGLDPLERWPAEPSFLVLDVDADAVAALAREFGQAAIVVGEAGTAARLLEVGAEPAQAPPRRGSSRASATVKEAPPTASPERSTSTE